MPKRLQVILEDPEYREVQDAAVKKLESIRVAARFDFPSGDIERMLNENEAFAQSRFPAIT